MSHKQSFGMNSNSVRVMEVLLLSQEPPLIGRGKRLSEGLLAQTASRCEALETGKLSRANNDEFT